MLRAGRAPIVVAAAVAVLLTGCCPVTSPPTTAFLARLQPLGHGLARADLPDGRELIVSGVARVPSGLAYVTGSLLTDGTVKALSVQPAAGYRSASGASR